MFSATGSFSNIGMGDSLYTQANLCDGDIGNLCYTVMGCDSETHSHSYSS